MVFDFNILVLILGLAIGAISALLGLGGGVLIVPLLPMVTTLSHHEVIGTSLFTILLVVSNNTFKFHKSGVVAWRAALIMGPLSALSAYAAARLGMQLSDDFLKSLLIAVYVLMAVWTLFKKQTEVSEDKEDLDRSTLIYLSIAAIVAGALSGLMGIGSGMVLGAVLLNLKVLPNAKLSPTTNAIMIFTCISGVLAYVSGGINLETAVIGKVHLLVALNLFIGAFISSYFARRYQHLISSKNRAKLLGGILLILAIKVYISL